MIKPICPICEFSKTNKSYNKSCYQYFHCPECRTLFLFPEPSKKILTEFYKNDYQNEAGKINEEKIRLRSRKIIKQLLKINPRRKSLLDIGSSFGFFADEARSRQLKVLAIEPSETLSQYSSKILRIRTINQTFEKFHQKFPQEKFDFITLIHVIEHVNRPKEFLTNIISHLNKNGVLFVETPNLDSHLFNFEKNNYTFLTPPDHLWVFSQKSFLSFRTNNNLSFFKTSTYSESSHLMGIFKIVLGHPQDVQAQEQKKSNKQTDLPVSKKIKILIFDKFLVRLIYRILNIGNHGSFLELYIKKIC